MLLLRVEIPDVPGSLGRLASAIGSAGGNIDAILMSLPPLARWK